MARPAAGGSGAAACTKAANSEAETRPSSSVSRASKTIANWLSSSMIFNFLRHITSNSSQSRAPELSVSCLSKNFLKFVFSPTFAFKRDRILRTGSSTKATSSSKSSSPERSTSRLWKTALSCASGVLNSGNLSTLRHIDLNSSQSIRPEWSLSSVRKSFAQSLPPAVHAASLIRVRIAVIAATTFLRVLLSFNKWRASASNLFKSSWLAAAKKTSFIADNCTSL
mmetsp:Transcript_11323/g.28460  ORF Transcript_11323/g.28460 Transcript_11323/m.28460 type:complete len:225 (+) Transcript_11323:86-760(+)